MTRPAPLIDVDGADAPLPAEAVRLIASLLLDDVAAEESEQEAAA